MIKRYAKIIFSFINKKAVMVKRLLTDDIFHSERRGRWL